MSGTEALSHFPEVWPLIFASDAARYFLFAGATFVLLHLFRSRLERYRIQRRRASNRDMLREVGWSALTALIFSLNGFLLVWCLMQMDLIRISESSGAAVVALQVLMIVLAHDAWFYWLHRAMHLRPLFRMAHLTHHRSVTPTSWAAYAFAPLEAVAEAVFLPLFLLLVPVDSVTIIIFLSHMMARNVIGHCGVEIMPRGWVDWPVARWITTPTHHDLHHACGRWNYGLYFTFWDRLMGTEHPDYADAFRRNAAGGAMQPEAGDAIAGDGTVTRRGRLRRVTGALVLIIGATLSGGAAPIPEDGAPGLSGIWATPGMGALVRIAPCDPARPEVARTCGTVIWSWATDGPRDVRIFSDLDARGDVISGAMLNPEDGETYEVTMRLAAPDRIDVRGCIWIMCQTQEWRRIDALLREINRARASD
ncbi:MAG: hypothetical protein DHS20C03_00910 [Minwuia thermotolerans]|nr:MAG: hypothetical protein DHS20C03_00910 [Minwuia thermotolerans]